MQCGMCESHVNDAIRRAFSVKKVTSSHKRGETVIVAEEDIPDDRLQAVIDQTGYHLQGITRQPYEKKGFLARFKG